MFISLQFESFMHFSLAFAVVYFIKIKYFIYIVLPREGAVETVSKSSVSAHIQCPTRILVA